MAADGLTKHVKCNQLDSLMEDGRLQVEFIIHDSYPEKT